MRTPRLTVIVLALGAVLLPLGLVSTAGAAQSASYPFQNPNLPLKARLADLMGRLTLDEKISLLHQYEPAIPRLGIKAFKTGTEALHGVAWSNDASNGGAVTDSHGTSFPQAVGLASTWDPALIKQVGTAVGQDARGYNATNPGVWGLNLWAPVVNLLRNPLWGRNEEGYSEDPYLTSTIATAYGTGIEGSTSNPKYLLAAPTLKHYLAYNNETDRTTSSSQVPPQVLQDYDRAAFRGPLQAGAATGAMASYNEVNGRPSTVNPDLATTERSWSPSTLMNVTDAGANYNLLPGAGNDNYYPDIEHVDAAAIKAGVDSFTTDNTDPANTVNAVKAALNDGLLTTADINRAASDILTIRFRLGDFDPDGGPYAKIGPSVIDDTAHQKLSRQAADEAMVLLKNSGGALPLDPSATKKVAVVGPLENTLYNDWYSGNLPYAVTPLDGITQRLGSGAVSSSEGVDRLALKDTATGKYVTFGSGPGGAKLAEAATAPDSSTQFDTFDWGDGILTLRAAANGKYVNYENGGFVNDQAQPNGWYVQQMFKLDPQPDGSYVLQYAGYDTQESWFGPDTYVTVGPDGTLKLGASSPAQAAHFSRDVITDGISSAVNAAKGAGAAVVVVGSMPFINGREAHDRTDMNLASGQEALVEAVTKANPHTIVVVEDSYPTTINWEQQNDPAILWTTHAGQETGHALADVLFGGYDPSGRLTQTWPQSISQVPSLNDYDIVKPGQTYMYSSQPALYPFGYGLSYTTFTYSGMRLSAPAMGEGGQVTATVDVTNTGSRAGSDIVQLYDHEEHSRVQQPSKKLIGFQRVSLRPGQTAAVQFPVKASDLQFWDVTRSKWVLETSSYDLMAGGSPAGTTQSATLAVHGEVIPPRDLSAATQAQNFDDYSSGVQLVDTSKAAGTSVGSTGSGQWIKFAGSRLAGPRTFSASAASAGSGGGSIQVRLDNPSSGPLLGSVQVPDTGSVYNYQTVTTPLSSVTGQHDVYLVFTGQARLDTFSLR
jgi:beta-glucosidase